MENKTIQITFGEKKPSLTPTYDAFGVFRGFGYLERATCPTCMSSTARAVVVWDRETTGPVVDKDTIIIIKEQQKRSYVNDDDDDEVPAFFCRDTKTVRYPKSVGMTPTTKNDEKYVRVGIYKNTEVFLTYLPVHTSSEDIRENVVPCLRCVMAAAGITPGSAFGTFGKVVQGSLGISPLKTTYVLPELFRARKWKLFGHEVLNVRAFVPWTSSPEEGRAVVVVVDDDDGCPIHIVHEKHDRARGDLKKGCYLIWHPLPKATNRHRVVEEE